MWVISATCWLLALCDGALSLHAFVAQQCYAAQLMHATLVDHALVLAMQKT
jgi:hypothetical protein